MLGNWFCAVCNPTKEIIVDEAMIPFKGRSSLTQYLPMKLIKQGIKIWMQADATTGCVRLSMFILAKREARLICLGSRVVKGLCEDLYHTYCHILQLLFQHEPSTSPIRAGLYSCETLLQSNCKGFPKPLKPLVKKGLAKRGDSKTYQQGNLSVSVWQDNWPVATISIPSRTQPKWTVYKRRVKMVWAVLILVCNHYHCTTGTWVELIKTINFVAATTCGWSVESTSISSGFCWLVDHKCIHS